MIAYTTQINGKRKRFKPIKCPACTRGRICDAPAASQTLAVCGDMGEDADSIIIKCPLCGMSVSLTIHQINPQQNRAPQGAGY